MALLKRVCSNTDRCLPWLLQTDLFLLIPDFISSCCLQLLFFHFCFCSDVFKKSQDLLVDELNRCSLLGLNLFNFHPGSSLGSITTEQCCEKIAGAINHAHRQTAAVVTGDWLVQKKAFRRTLASSVTDNIIYFVRTTEALV